MTYAEIERNIGMTVRIKYTVDSRPMERVGVILNADMDEIIIEPLEIPDELKVPSYVKNKDEKEYLLSVVEESRIRVKIVDIKSIINCI